MMDASSIKIDHAIGIRNKRGWHNINITQYGAILSNKEIRYSVESFKAFCNMPLVP